ncbi:MAG: hypothetical protein K2X08_04505 [Chlamydiales bacterium]|nr:hypothetical protein [Chlamydiales bacterium]
MLPFVNTPSPSDVSWWSEKPFGNFEPLRYYEDKRPKEVPYGCVKSAVFTVVGMVDRDTAPRLEFKKMIIDYVGNLTWRHMTAAEGEARCNESPECKSYYSFWKQSLEGHQRWKQNSALDKK